MTTNDRTTQALLAHRDQLAELSLDKPLDLQTNLAVAQALALVTLALELRDFRIVTADPDDFSTIAE